LVEKTGGSRENHWPVPSRTSPSRCSHGNYWCVHIHDFDNRSCQ
jgi:hypothetical protein